ncbi:TonB-dependent Receptor Plug Domain protein [Methyloligella halotolerans]|uniref:TonB-dependent Receptor Plug Domain protein n=1 Tax=Methyloligella halotolerans TaxID=1177755 RepID=A0A1E2RZ08_9HYPH|nr:Plug domain-containing protein [Methyloligella halotolerans]ODA67451.1 TonB-dependent Receptor Plug Domain protein [Methyloligella halotolerans]
MIVRGFGYSVLLAGALLLPAYAQAQDADIEQQEVESTSPEGTSAPTDAAAPEGESAAAPDGEGEVEVPAVEVIQEQPQPAPAPPPRQQATRTPRPAPAPAPAPVVPVAQPVEGFEADQSISTLPPSGGVPMSPVKGSEIPAQLVPSAFSYVNGEAFGRQDYVDPPAQVLEQQVPSVIQSDLQGNEFQTNIQYRGFESSPVQGVAQGLAVYQNGVRINEAFGDIVNYDFLPEIAIQDMTIVSGNPIYGLNALGGALTIQMKDGFSYQARRSLPSAVRSAACRATPRSVCRAATGRPISQPSGSRIRATGTSRNPIFAGCMPISASATARARCTST